MVEQGLSQARIVASGLAIADREGLSAVTMRCIASELGVATMSVYGYVLGKDELVLILADAAFAEQALRRFERKHDLRVQLETAARAQWSVYRKHPWLAAAISILATTADTEWNGAHGVPLASAGRAHPPGAKR